MEQSFEKLGAFYLGRVRDVERGTTTSVDVLYDSKDLTTHALCVGMTGSGKTGLCISLLEEAGLDGIPAIVVDPKGDIGNLLLTFPDLRPEDFRPWIDEAEAARLGQTPDEHARHVAQQWREGLAEWGQDGERIRRFRAAVDLAVYTPGSSAGRPLTILKTFSAPPAALIQDVDAFRDRVSAAASGLLALLGIDADPVRSREFILISNLLDRAWREQRDMDLVGLIQQIQAPPISTIGVMEVDTFFPAKDRLALSMTLNSLLASPAFAAWLEGEALNIQDLLYTQAGKPRISILSIAHLSESERMFFVTMLLNELLTWVRGQAGTPSLRALFYMDEVFGYFPPVRNPPAKQPMLTLLKQARAFGVGLVLATQNPVDLDYKGLANCGTWFLGRLQTERDKARVLDGLEGASAQAGAQVDRQTMDKILSALAGRMFLMNNVHEKEPVVFQTRWAMSYLCGPLTRDQIRVLTKEPGGTPPTAEPHDTEQPTAERRMPQSASELAPAAGRLSGLTSRPPELPSIVTQQFLPIREPRPIEGRLVYRPGLCGRGRLHFVRAALHVDVWQERQILCLTERNPEERLWEQGQFLRRPLGTQPAAEPDAEFSPLPAELMVAKNYARWQQKLKELLYRTQCLEIFRCAALKEFSRVGETEAEFQIRLTQRAREQRDADIEKLRGRYASNLATLQQRIRRAQDTVDREQSEYRERSVDTAISVGTSIFGALFGRKVLSRKNVDRASSSARRAGRVARQKDDVAKARETLDMLLQQRRELEEQAAQEVARIDDAFRTEHLQLETLQVRPRKSDITVEPLTLVWLPWRVDDTGSAQPAYEVI
ncbi:MAG: ATP-binding protein [Pirellulaceae bacterium]